MEPQLPKVHENTKKGNVAVALLECVLSKFSIVNIIPVEKDIGIDCLNFTNKVPHII